MAPLVMVIEDEEALGLLLKYNLEKEGYEVILETRGNKALAEIEKYGRRLFCWTGCCPKFPAWKSASWSAASLTLKTFRSSCSQPKERKKTKSKA